MQSDVHLRDLRYFVAVAEELHFTRAAEQLFIAQPSLSRQIRQLEKRLGVVLFDRDRRTVALTEAGQALLPEAQELVAGWDAAVTRLRRISTASTGRLRVGMSATLGRGLLPRVRAAFVATRPDAALVVRQVSWSDPTAGLADGHADVGFLWLPLPEPDVYRWLLVAEEPRKLLLPPGHRLAGKEEVTIADVIDEPFLGLPEESGTLRDYWLGLEERAGAPVTVAAEISGTDETFEALATGVGVCFVAEGNASGYERDGVTAVGVRDLSPSRLVLAWRRDDHRDLVRDFVATTRRVTGSAYNESE
ncbi:LysR family transcriptional regulator [Amycolatopsis azurea]|uniref:LysR family transcriptional regulator n=1 Tax=Amycolatopsis azurea TaxID=36819 RepID=UPI00381A70C3